MQATAGLGRSSVYHVDMKTLQKIQFYFYKKRRIRLIRKARSQPSSLPLEQRVRFQDKMNSSALTPAQMERFRAQYPAIKFP